MLRINLKLQKYVISKFPFSVNVQSLKIRKSQCYQKLVERKKFFTVFGYRLLFGFSFPSF